MLTTLWLKGIIAYRFRRLFAALLGVALTVALLGALGAFIANASASMTARAIADVPVDWQVQLTSGANSGAVVTALGQVSHYRAVEQVDYASVNGFSANVSGTVQTTGAGKVIGLSPQYATSFPAELRLLLGSSNGVLVMQQTAANLHVSIGDHVTIARPNLPDATVTVAGIVDLPQADSLFQAVGAPAGLAPTAPPDNVLVLPRDLWHQFFDAQTAARPDTVHTQLHVRLAADLPPDPAAAYVYVQQLANNLEARLVGQVVVGNNLAARLGGVREDALYAQVLFLFLGLPGAVLAALLTLAVAAAGAEHRRREQALLRVRGASTAELLRLASVEAITLGLGGVVLGLILAYVATLSIAADANLLAATTLPWTILAAVVGLLLALFAVLYPAWQSARRSTVAGARLVVGRTGAPLWQRLYLDLALLAIAAFSFWQTASSGYQIVLAPEGVAQTAVDYTSFLAPLCLWLGVGLLTMRLWRVALTRGRALVAGLLRPIAQGLSRLVAAALGRQSPTLVRGVALVALAFSFATATAVFNTTYNTQARIDAQLTNGADVTVTGTSAAPAGPLLGQLAAQPGVAAAQPLMHRFAYVGSDLQDIYGVDPQRIGSATNVANAFFANRDAAATLALLARTPDGVLVSAETAKDFQLALGDQLSLRLQTGADRQYHAVTFHFIGVVREFPSAPKDSFLVANASYIAAQSGNPTAEIVLLRANGSAKDLAAQVRPLVGSVAGARVTDLGQTAQAISSSLTAVDLGGLTLLELTFAILLVAGASGLVLALGLAERRRTFAILTALGASDRQLGAFFWSEGLIVLLGGGIIGLALGFGLAQMLVTVLTGVFDPAPEALSVPWLYLAALALAGVVSTVVAVLSVRVFSRRAVGEALREI